MKKKLHWLSSAIFFTGFIVLWQLFSLGRKTLIYPSPVEVLQSMAGIITGNVFLPSVFNTVKAVLLSFAAAFIPALILGIAGKFMPFLHRVMEDISGVIRSVPTVAIILMALLLLPVSATPVVICFFVVFPVLYTNISEGLVSTDPQLLEMARIYRIERERIIRYIYIPSLKPFIAAGCRSALGLSFKVMVTAEVFNFVTQNTIGAQMYLRKIQIDLAGIIAWTIIVIVLSMLFDLVLKKLFEEKRR
jgi:NitT/TauT family transport system permease protein